MATYRVMPANDGLDMRSNWIVMLDGRTVSNHVKKSAAVRTARKKASLGDELVIHRTDGTIQETRTVSGSRGGQESSSSGGTAYGLATFKNGIADAFDR
jgi:hypothetical protein